MRRIAQITLTIFCTLLAFVLLWAFRPALELFVGSVAIAAALRPLVRQTEDRGIPRGYAILLWYVLALALLGVVGGLFLLNISGEAASALEGFPSWYRALVAQLQQGDMLGQALAQALPPPEVLALPQAPAFTGTLTGLVGGAVAQIVLVMAMLSLSFYWLSEVTHFERLWLSLLPVGARIRARAIWRNAENAVGAYIRATLAATMCAGLLLLGAYRLLDQIPAVGMIPFAATLALLGGISHLVPRVGPGLVVLLSAAVAASTGLASAAAVGLVGIAIHIGAHHLGEWVLHTGSERVNPLLQVLLLLALGEVGGFGAMIFAPPLAALVQVLNNSLRAATVNTPSQQAAFAMLHQRLDQVEQETEAEQHELLNVLRRSRDLVGQAQQLLE